MAVALILAAGRGERFGADRPKALVELGGRPLLRWSLDVLAGVPSIEQIVVALPAGVALSPEIVEPVGVPASKGLLVVEGGAVRSESVRRALETAGPGDPVLVHDAARPLITVELVERTLAALDAEGVDAAVAAAPVTDTVKRVDTPSGAHGGDGLVTETLDRSALWAAQTPQVFRRAALERALDVSDEVLAQATDDAWLVERSQGRVVIVPAPRENLKITTPLDLAVAELLLSERVT